MKVEKEQYLNSINLNVHTEFPYLVLEVVNDRAYPQNPGFNVMHWHEDLQFIYVLNGTVEVRTLDSVVQINAGEGVFINKDVVHYVRRIGNCHYNSFLFPTCFLEFYTGSPAKTFVDSLISSKQLSLYCFHRNNDWCNKVLSLLEQLVGLEKNKTEFYIYEVFVCLSALWLTMIKNIIIPLEKMENAVSIRMQKILRNIAEHYAEDLTLTDLAKSASISKSECSRCFKVSLNTTPYKYLTEFRLSKAAQLLKRTAEPVGNIAESVGFHQMSHFGKCFKEKTGYSPREYREMEKDNT